MVPQGDTTATKPYFTLNLTTAGKDGGAVETVPFRERVMIALIDKKNTVLELKFTSDPLCTATSTHGNRSMCRSSTSTRPPARLHASR